jgi:hypothetical protein
MIFSLHKTAILVAFMAPHFVAATDNFVLNLQEDVEITSGDGADYTSMELNFDYDDFIPLTKKFSATLLKVVGGNCVPGSPVDATSIFIETPLIQPALPGPGTIPITVTYAHDTISSESQFFDGSNPEEAIIQFCVRLDYLYDNDLTDAVDAKVYGSLTGKIKVTTDLKASCKFCPIDLTNTKVEERDVDKELEEHLCCSLCMPDGYKGPFRLGDTVNICVTYKYPGSDICVHSLTGASLRQSKHNLPDTQACYNNFFCWLADQIGECSECFLEKESTVLDLDDGVVVSVAPMDDKCGMNISFVIGKEWFVPPHAGNPLSIKIDALLGYGANSRRLGRELADPIPATTNLEEPLSLINCEQIEKQMIGFNRKVKQINKQIKAAKKNAALKKLLTQQRNMVLKKVKGLESDRAVCEA